MMTGKHQGTPSFWGKQAGAPGWASQLAGHPIAPRHQCEQQQQRQRAPPTCNPFHGPAQTSLS